MKKQWQSKCRRRNRSQTWNKLLMSRMRRLSWRNSTILSSFSTKGSSKTTSFFTSSVNTCKEESSLTYSRIDTSSQRKKQRSILPKYCLPSSIFINEELFTETWSLRTSCYRRTSTSSWLTLGLGRCWRMTEPLLFAAHLSTWRLRLLTPKAKDMAFPVTTGLWGSSFMRCCQDQLLLMMMTLIRSSRRSK